MELLRISLLEIAEILHVDLLGEDCIIDGLNLSNRSILAESALSFCSSKKYFRSAIRNTKIKALIITSELYASLSENEKKIFSFLLVDNPEVSFYRLFIRLIETGHFFPKFDWNSVLGDTLIFPGAIIEAGVILGKNVIIGCNSVIKSGTIIGDNVTIGTCSVIGGEGFQLIKIDGNNICVPHIGRVCIESHVTIGDNVTISRSLFEGFTEVGEHTKIDNHVHVAHNCIIGKNCVLAANSILFGSCELKNNVWVSPNATVMNRIVVEDGAFIGASSFVVKNVKSGCKVFGMPAEII